MSRTAPVLSSVCQCSELGEVQVSMNYSPSLQQLTLGVLRARGLQLLSDTGEEPQKGPSVAVEGGASDNMELEGTISHSVGYVQWFPCLGFYF